jgi:hypothetical protein
MYYLWYHLRIQLEVSTSFVRFRFLNLALIACRIVENLTFLSNVLVTAVFKAIFYSLRISCKDM